MTASYSVTEPTGQLSNQRFDAIDAPIDRRSVMTKLPSSKHDQDLEKLGVLLGELLYRNLQEVFGEGDAPVAIRFADKDVGQDGRAHALGSGDAKATVQLDYNLSGIAPKGPDRTTTCLCIDHRFVRSEVTRRHWFTGLSEIRRRRDDRMPPFRDVPSG
jgi:hypothetical protein